MTLEDELTHYYFIVGTTAADKCLQHQMCIFCIDFCIHRIAMQHHMFTTFRSTSQTNRNAALPLHRSLRNWHSDTWKAYCVDVGCLNRHELNNFQTLRYLYTNLRSLASRCKDFAILCRSIFDHCSYSTGQHLSKLGLGQLLHHTVWQICLCHESVGQRWTWLKTVHGITEGQRRICCSWTNTYASTLEATEILRLRKLSPFHKKVVLPGSPRGLPHAPVHEPGGLSDPHHPNHLDVFLLQVVAMFSANSSYSHPNHLQGPSYWRFALTGLFWIGPELASTIAKAYIPQLRHARVTSRNRRRRKPSRDRRHRRCPARGPSCAGGYSPKQTKANIHAYILAHTHTHTRTHAHTHANAHTREHTPDAPDVIYCTSSRWQTIAPLHLNNMLCKAAQWNEWFARYLSNWLSPLSLSLDHACHACHACMHTQTSMKSIVKQYY